MTPKTVFIVGVGRSGTSLMQSMIAAHPRVSYLPETAFIRRMVFSSCLQSILKKHGEKVVSKTLAQNNYFVRTGLDASKVVARASARGGLLDVAVYREMLTLYTAKNKTWVGDKDPRAVEFLPLLAAVLPDVHLIQVYRDPRDVLASKKKAAWSRKSHVWKHIFANRVQIAIGSRLGPELFGKKYHEICYEELLAEPEKVLSRLCRNLALEYDHSMLSFGDAARKLVTDQEMSWKKETLGPLLTENREKWKTDLRLREVVLSELCCGEAMAKGGYARDQRNHRLSLKDRLWVLFGWLVIVMGTWPYMKYRHFRVRRVCRRIE
ncbi:Sulfotransferase family protein [Desulfofustis glycolicus DSM 9705]|uniref:Sulfotransferase family protein n=2 Tax=Desulfofustis glycolicus TaxID=51195 RepID=A0A1M5VPL1_9BACT|nr:Sulfotransferase family protein [Desulfofustis glycolicus DSM 9705]